MSMTFLSAESDLKRGSFIVLRLSKLGTLVHLAFASTIFDTDFTDFRGFSSSLKTQE